MTVAEVVNMMHLEYCLRAVVVTCYALFLFKIGNARLFSQLAAYDLIIFMILGALLGMAIIDEKYFIPMLLCSLLITLLHKFLGSLNIQHHAALNFLKGERLILYAKQMWNVKNLKLCSLTKDDVFQELRCSMGIDSTENIDKIMMERNGAISFLLKKPHDEKNKT